MAAPRSRDASARPLLASVVRSKLRLRVGGKFFLTVGVLVPAVLAVAGVGTLGLQRLAARTDDLYSRSLPVSQHTTDVLAAGAAIHETALYQVAVHDQRTNDRLTDELDATLIPALRDAIEVLARDYATGSPGRAGVDAMTGQLQQYLELRQTGAYEDPPGSSESEAARTALATRTDELLEPLVTGAKSLANAEAAMTVSTKRAADVAYRSTLVLLAVTVLAVLLAGIGVVLALIRNMVPRIRRYSEFAANVANSRPTTELRPQGDDELTELGRALDDMVRQRQRLAGQERLQGEFVDTLQVTRSESEAQELVQRHLERLLPGSQVVVLRSNNSANRLQPVTVLPADSNLPARLAGAEPRSCIAVRLGRTHREGNGEAPLLGCSVCELRDGPSSCEPLLVGGEVIGSVLVSHADAIPDRAEARIKTTVEQAAPVLANLRSLALAEFRANNDFLTGIPNKRATEDTVKRMVAQASRSVTSLTAIMLDLDHFKHINDEYGHAKGDEVLAAVGQAIKSDLRTSDFAGRFGGEEFLILLPETGAEGGWQVAEKIRRTIAGIRVAGVERDISASLGIAELLEHAGSATGLLREADRAQYAAKAAGRNRSIIASAVPPAENDPEGAPDVPSVQGPVLVPAQTA